MQKRLKYLPILLLLLAFTAKAADLLEVYHITLPAYEESWYSEDDAGQVKYKIEVNDKTRTYHTYAPADNEGAPRPAILLLHGSGRSGVSLVEKWRTMAEFGNIILIGPDAQANWSIKTDGLDFLDAVLADAKTHYNIDPKRIYLFGHSRGAQFSLYISILRSEVFAAMAMHAGMFGTESDYSYVEKAKRKIPVALMVGTNDAIFPLGRVRASAEAFVSRGHETALYIFDGHTHWYYDAAPSINAKAWDFLQKHHLD